MAIPTCAFITNYSLYEFKTMQFGMKITQRTYEWLMEQGLSEKQWTCWLIYMDEVGVYGKT